MVGDAASGGRGDGLARAEVSRVARMRAAGDLEANAVAALEAVRVRPELDRDAARTVCLTLARLGTETNNAVTDIHRLGALTVHVAESNEEIGVLEARADIQRRRRSADDVEISRQRVGCVGEYVG